MEPCVTPLGAEHIPEHWCITEDRILSLDFLKDSGDKTDLWEGILRIGNHGVVLINKESCLCGKVLVSQDIKVRPLSQVLCHSQSPTVC